MNNMTSLHAQAEEEMRDSMMYQDLAEEFDQEGHHGEAAILRDIAHEEMMHSKHLKDIISSKE